MLNIEVPSGALNIEARVDWLRSRPLLIEATPDQKIEIEVSNRTGGLWAITLWATTFGFRSSLVLEQLPNATIA